MWHKQKNKNPIIRLALLLALASTPMMTSLFKSEYVLAQTPETPSFELPTEVEKGTTIKVDGSASMTRANEALKQRFEKEYSGANVEVASNGTDDALRALQDGTIDIAAIGRSLTPEEEKLGLEQQRLRREKIAIIVGKNNPFKGDLSNQLFTQLYRGQITNWSELGGPSKEIRVIDLPESSDTRQAFRNYPLFDGNLNTGSNAVKLDSDDPAAVINELGDDGIGFVLANQVEKLGDEVRVLSMHKVLPTDARYPYSQPLVYVFKKNPSQAVKNFVGFATAEPGQEALKAARDEEAAAVAAVVARGVTNDAPDATVTPQSTETPTAEGTAGSQNQTANSGAATPGVEPATNTSASNGSSSRDQAYLQDSTVVSEAGEGTIPWWWILLPVAAIGALALWWLLGRRKSQEDDTVARGVLPKDSPPPFTPTSTSTTGAVKEPLPVVNTPDEPNAATVEFPRTTSDVNEAGVAGLGAAAAMSSRDNENAVAQTSADLQQPDVPDSGLNTQSTYLQQSDVSNQELDLSSNLSSETPDDDLEQPDIPDTSLDLEAPAAVVNSSYHSLPRINTPVNNVEAPPITEEVGDSTPTDDNQVDNLVQSDSPQSELPSASTNNWLGNFGLGAGVAGAAAAAAGAQRIKSRLAGREQTESVEDESEKNNQTVAYPQLPDVWDSTQSQQSNTQLDSSDSDNGTLEDSNNTVENSDVTSPDDLWGPLETAEPITQEEEETSFSGLIRNNVDNVERSPQDEASSLWETPETVEPITQEEEETSSDSGLINNDVDAVSANNVEQPSQDEASSLWETPETVEPITQEEDSGLINDDVDAVSTNNVEQPSQDEASSLWGTPETEQPITEETQEEESSLPNGGIAAAGIVAGAAAIGSNLLNRDNDDTSDEGNNADEQNTDNQENASNKGGLGRGWFFNRFRKDTPDATDDTQAAEIVETSELPFVRITNENESADAQTTPPQEQRTTDGLPNVWVTQPLQQTTTPEETSQEEIAQFGVSSTSGENSTSTDGAVLAGGAEKAVGAFTLGQISSNDEESDSSDAQDQNVALGPIDREEFDSSDAQGENATLENSQQSNSLDAQGENVALDRIADQAEIDTQIHLPEQHSDPGDTDWDRIYGIHHNGATGVPGESNILLANRTPKWAYASWNIAPADREAMQERGANQLVLRLYDVTNVDLSYQKAKLVQQYECEESVSHRYVAIPNTDRDYISEIGYLNGNKEWLLVSRSPIIRVFSRPHKDFWFEADAELIIHGATEPGSSVTIDGQNIKVKQDGTFHLRVPFTESLINYLITSVAPDSEQAKTIHMQFSQTERKDS
jgi:phosphate transport system substrate-binding protein